MSNKSKEPKVLFYDIETSPFLVWTFNIGNKVRISHDSILEGWGSDIITICYKWAHESQVHSLDWGFKKQDSSSMIKKFDEIISQADIVIAHNGDRFDWKHLNTQRMLQGLPTIDWTTKSEDTLKQIRKHFYLPSYRLDYIGKRLGVGAKDGMAFSDWIKIVMKEDKSALDKMIKYCKQDVKLLEAVYNKVKPYMKPKVNMAQFKQDICCTVCGSDNIVKNGTRFEGGKLKQKFYCKSHGGYAGSSTKPRELK